MSARKRNTLTRQVRRAYRQDALASILTLPESEFGSAFGMKTTEVDQRPWGAGKNAPCDYYHFRDNGASVLAVAHLDTVVPASRRAPSFIKTTRHGPRVQSGALDDRLGAYVILSLLPGLGVTCDWLLTVGEESGQSTASFFTPPRDYDHVIEFDRGGTDVVMYQYADQASRAAVQASGATTGTGSFSDICSLEHLGVKAFNWGVGYDGNYHSENGFAFLEDTFAMVAKYLRFHAQNAGTAMPHVARPQEPLPGYWASGKRCALDCDICLARWSVDTVTLICRECRSCWDCGMDELECACLASLKESAIEEEGAADAAATREEEAELVRKSWVAADQAHAAEGELYAAVRQREDA